MFVECLCKPRALEKASKKWEHGTKVQAEERECQVQRPGGSDQAWWVLTSCRLGCCQKPTKHPQTHRGDK